MKNWSKALLALLLIVLATGNLSCASKTEELTPTGQVVEVKRGTLVKTVSATGNLTMPHQSTLIFGVAGVVSEVLVDEGDLVTKGQALAKLETDDLERAVTRAKASLRTAQINLEKLKELYTSADKAQAEAAVKSAEASLAAAQDALEKAREPYSEADKAQAEAAVKSAEASLAVAQDALEDVLSPYSEDDLATAEAKVRDCQVALENAQRNLTVAQKSAELAVQKAQDELESAQKVYEDYVKAHIGNLTHPDIAEQKDKLWEAVLRAQENLEIAQLQKETSIATAENNVLQAEEALKKARQDLEDMKSGPDPVKVQQAQAQVASAQAALAKAKEQLEEINAGPDPLDLELKQIQVELAQLSLQEAQEKLEKATLLAPFDGVVAVVKVEAGDMVSAGTPAIQLVDTSQVEVEATVDEIDVAQLKPGQPAIITLDALPEARLRGRVTFVSPVATMQAGVVTYPVRLEIEGSVEGLRQGMTAVADIVVERKENVLWVPSRAIRTIRGQSVVQVLVDGKIEERTVQVGMSDEWRTEIVEGLREGEKVLVPTPSATTSSGRQGPAFRRVVVPLAPRRK
ncbi:MAG: hypothetical protein DRI26_02925 [Chloroflexi bacterium]|nr:MAG: hypothetical protein DRI26_02925 [Chloroflexota bacterium]